MHTDRRPVDYSSIACFLIGFSVMVPIVPESRLTLFDVIASVLILRHWHPVQAMFRRTATLLAVSLLAMAVSAHFNASGLYAFLGRAYQPPVLLVEAIGYCILLCHTDAKGRAALVAGAMLGICAHYFYPSDLRILDEPIKFLIGTPLGAGLLALCALAAIRAGAERQGSLPIPLVVGLMMVYALFCFLLGSRSIGGVYFISAIAVVAVGFVRTPPAYAKFAPLMILVVAVAGYGFTELYTVLAINGYFGDRAAGIAAFQSSFGSIILGGRPEIIVNLSGIRDAPWLGVGISNYPSLYLYEMVRLSVYAQSDVLDFSNILYHSTIFATAFESGIISALFWIYMAYRAIFAVPVLNSMSVTERAFILPLLIITIWHLLYSPPIPYNRFIMSIGMGFAFYIYALWDDARRKLQIAVHPDPAWLSHRACLPCK